MIICKFVWVHLNRVMNNQLFRWPTNFLDWHSDFRKMVSQLVSGFSENARYISNLANWIKVGGSLMTVDIFGYFVVFFDNFPEEKQTL